MPGVTVNVSLLLRDGALEHLIIAAPAAPASAPPTATGTAGAASADAKHSGALSPTTAAAASHGRISWVRLLQELVTATHAFSVEDDGPVVVDAAGTSPTGKSLVPQGDANASTRGVADCFHIAFTDDENDLVTLTNDSGLAEAYRVIEKSRKPALELSVTVLHPPPALSAFTAAGGNATASALDFKTIRTPQLAAAVAAAAAATSAYGAPGGAPVAAAAAAAAAPPLQRPGSGPTATAAVASAAPNGGAVPHAQLPPGALPDSKLNPILGAITATVGGRPSAAAEAAGNAAAAAALQQLNGDDTSPFKEVVMKHTRRALQAFESFFLNLKKDHYVARTRRNQTFARVDEARTPQYAALKAKHQAELTAMDARLQRNIDLLVTEFDRCLSVQSPASFLLPLLVSISVENRGMRFEVPVRPCDTVADLRDALMDLSARKMPGAGSAPPDPIVDFGPCSYFTLRRIGASDGKSQFVSSGGFASPSVSPPPGAGKSAEINPTNFLDFLFGATPRKASSGKGGYESPPGSGNGKPLVIAPDREAHTSMAELGVTHGAEFVLIGGVRRKSEPPKCVVGQRNANANAQDPSVPHHFACAECKETALCRGCAMTCHFGHTITIAPAADQPKPGQLQCGCGVVSTPAPAGPAAAGGAAAAAAAGAAAGAVAGAGAGGVLAASACRIRERASALPPSQQPYTEELQLLRAMGYSDDMVQHMTMLVPAAALSPVPSPAPTPAPAAPAPAPTPSPPPPSQAGAGAAVPPPTVVVVVDAKAAPASAAVDSKAAAPPAAGAAGAAGAAAAAGGGSPVKPPQSGAAANAGAASAAASAAAGASAPAGPQAMVTVGVTLRALLQSKSGNVQSVVDTLLGWERQGKLVTAANANANTNASANPNAPLSGYKPAASRPSPVAPVRRS